MAALIVAGLWAEAAHAATPAGRLASSLRALAQPSVRSASPARRARLIGLPASGPASLVETHGRVRVDVWTNATSSSFVRALRNAGARIGFVDDRLRRVTVDVAPADLTRLAAVPGVRTIQPELRPMTSAVTCPWGQIRSEADVQLHAADARSAFGVTGSGVNVGVISDSYDDSDDAGAVSRAADDIAGGDLPGTTNPCGFRTPVDLLAEGSSPTQDEDEGRAMMQVVHDLAPGASLAFAAADPESAFPSRVQAFWQLHGARVIADDITYFDEPFFQDGPPAVAADDAVAHNAAYFSSAANNSFEPAPDTSSWEAPAYRNTTCPIGLGQAEAGCMNFGTAGSPSAVQTFTVSGGGGRLLIDLQWAEPWFGVNHDYDVFLLDHNTHTLITSNTTINGGASGDPRPFAFLGVANNGFSSAQVDLVVGNRNATTGPRLKWVLVQPFGNGVTALPAVANPADITGPTIFGHNGAASGMSVAAVPFNNSGTVEDYSSRGPVTHYFGPVTSSSPAPPLAAPAVLAKPDVAATDGAQTTFFPPNDAPGPFRFFGTSESAPHAAAVAALSMQAAPRDTALQVEDAERASGVQVGAFGPSAEGHGLVNAGQAVSNALAVQPPVPTPTPTPTPTPQPPPTCTPTATARHRQHVRKKAVVTKVTALNAACTGKVTGSLKIKGRRKAIKLKTARFSLAVGQTKSVKLKLSKKTVAAVRRALRHHHRVTVTLTVRANGIKKRISVRLVR